MDDSIKKGEQEKHIRQISEIERRNIDRNFKKGIISSDDATKLEKEIKKLEG